MSRTIGKWMRPLSLVIVAGSLALSPLQAASNECATPKTIELRDDVFDDVRSVNGLFYSQGAMIECDGELMFSFGGTRPLEFRHSKFVTATNPEGWVRSGGSLHVVLDNDLGFNDPEYTEGSTVKVQFAISVGRTNYFIAYRYPQWPGSTNLSVTRDPVTNKWVIEAGADAKAQLLTISKGKYQIAAPAEVMPFKITVHPQ